MYLVHAFIWCALFCGFRPAQIPCVLLYIIYIMYNIFDTVLKLSFLELLSMCLLSDLFVYLSSFSDICPRCKIINKCKTTRLVTMPECHIEVRLVVTFCTKKFKHGSLSIVVTNSRVFTVTWRLSS